MVHCRVNLPLDVEIESGYVVILLLRFCLVRSNLLTLLIDNSEAHLGSCVDDRTSRHK